MFIPLIEMVILCFRWPQSYILKKCIYFVSMYNCIYVEYNSMYLSFRAENCKILDFFQLYC